MYNAFTKSVGIVLYLQYELIYLKKLANFVLLPVF